MNKKPSYEELTARIAELEELFRILHNQEIDQFVGDNNNLLPRVNNHNEMLVKQRRSLENLVAERENLIEELASRQAQLKTQAEELKHFRDHLEELVILRTKELRELSHRLVNDQEQERRTIGNELHDEIGQLLTYTIMLIDRAQRKQDFRILEEARTTVQETISKIRDLSAMLSPRLLQSAGLIQAVNSMIAEYTGNSLLRVDFRHPELIGQVFEQQALVIYRIIQEALSNAVKHSGATLVKIKLTSNENGFSLEISDNGRGFDSAKLTNSTGLTGMRERAGSLGGKLSIESSPGKGTKIKALLPYSVKLEKK